jgi:hypothetical protein
MKAVYSMLVASLNTMTAMNDGCIIQIALYECQSDVSESERSTNCDIGLISTDSLGPGSDIRCHRPSLSAPPQGTGSSLIEAPTPTIPSIGRGMFCGNVSFRQVRHALAKDETAASLSAQYGASIRGILRFNGLCDESALSALPIGYQILIPLS